MGEGRSAYRKEAKKIVDSNKYMVLATADTEGKPWSATVAFAYDKDYNFYFISAVDSRHAENISKNPRVSFVIFDSTQDIGDSEGIQAEGRASVVERGDVEKVIGIYVKRLFPKSDMAPSEMYRPEYYSGASEFRFFRIKATGVNITGTEDRRTEVDLRETEDE